MLLDYLHQRGPTHGLRATSSLRSVVTRLTQLFVNLLLITTGSFLSFNPKDVKIIVILTSSATLCTGATYATDYNNPPQNISSPGKNCVRHKMFYVHNLHVLTVYDKI